MSMCLGCPVPVLRERQQLLVPVWWVLLWLCHHLLNLSSTEEHGAISKVLLLNTTNIINFMQDIYTYAIMVARKKIYSNLWAKTFLILRYIFHPSRTNLYSHWQCGKVHFVFTLLRLLLHIVLFFPLPLQGERWSLPVLLTCISLTGRGSSIFTYMGTFPFL